MARINTNVGALIAQRHLNNSYSALSSTLERLSTGLRINHGKDDPAGLIVSEQLRSEVSAVNQAVSNSQRASLIIATTEGALDEVAALLRSIQGKIVEAANTGAMSEDEIAANQLQIDSAIANSTTFAGRSLLNGALDYVTSGVQTSDIDALIVHGAQFGTQDYIPVTVNVAVSAQHGTLFFAGGSITSSVTLEIQGNLGTTTLSFVSGTAASAMVRAINQVSDATGVSAALDPSAGFGLTSVGLGSKQFVCVQALPGSGTFSLQDEGGETVIRDYGRDAQATINGASGQGSGNHLTLKTSSLDLELTLADTFGLGTTQFSITEGGAMFQIGPHINSNLQVALGVQSVAASRLGNGSLGYLSQIVTGGDYSVEKGKCREAAAIVDEAIRQISVLRGRLGAFEMNTLETNRNQLGITVENLTAASSAIRDADFAYETSQLTRDQVLVSAGTSALAMANQTPQMVLRLLGS